ncbi:MAG: hypothetical protein PHX78_07235 [bacterium]|nr:hypothetical protein [bacterium]
MKFTASYGLKNNDENYFVSLETENDMEIKNAPETIDELFELAKKAVQRQTEGTPLSKAEENDNGDEGKPEGKITPKQTKFIYTLLRNNKKIFGDDATDYLRKEFKVKLVKEISFKQADAFIKKLLQKD